MKISLFDQRNNFESYLIDLKKLKPLAYDKNKLNHKIQTEIIPGYANLSALDLKPFFDYKIFPENILQAYPQWLHEQREMKVDDTIVQQIQIPPLESFTQKIIVGVRIKEIFNTENCKGNSYETIQGHVEKGISIFKFNSQNGTVNFTIETFSTSNGFLLSAFQYLSSLYQNYCTKKALEFVSGNMMVGGKGCLY